MEPTEHAAALLPNASEFEEECPDSVVFGGRKGGPLRYRHSYMDLWRPVLEELRLPVVGVHVGQGSRDFGSRLLEEFSPPEELPRGRINSRRSSISTCSSAMPNLPR